jgi:hypothetical protein
MPVWATVLLSVLGGTGIVGLITTAVWNHIMNKKKLDAEKIRKYDMERQDEHTVEIIKKEIQPLLDMVKEEFIALNEKIDKNTKKTQEYRTSITEKLEANNTATEANTKATIVVLRDRMRCSLEFCKRQGYKTVDDVRIWNELFGEYVDLGGNHFKEFVNAWKEDMDALPMESEVKANSASKKRKGKTKLLEDK